MSLLGQGSSSRNTLPDDDDFDQRPDSAQQDGLIDSFSDDADDDDLSLDGIYDDDDDDNDQDIPPPTYEEPASTSAFSKFSDTKSVPVASTSSAFVKTPERLVPDFMFHSPNSPLRHSPVASLPHNPPVAPSSPLLRGPPVAPLPHGPLFTHNAPPRTYYPGVDVCIVCQLRPPYSRNGKSYPTCGLTCARVLDFAVNGKKSPPGTPGYTPPPPPPPPPPIHAYTMPVYDDTPQQNNPVRPDVSLISFLAGLSMAPSNPPAAGSSPSRRPRGADSSTLRRTRPQATFQNDDSTTSVANSPVPAAPLVATDPCVVCRKPLAPSSKYITCGLTCAEKLTTGGGRNPNMCNYCHRRPKLAGHDQCGQICAQAAKLACLLCKSRPKYKHYHLCGKTCKQISTKQTPLLLEVPMSHATWDMVQKKFDDAWKYGTKPAIKKIYKIIEGKTFLLPYDKYKKKVGRNTEVFRYHGTSRRCKLGTNGNTMLCNDNGCSLCCILKTSFKTAFANPHGAFGAGIYSSSAANKAYSYSSNGQGALVLTKVILGKVHNVSAFGAVSSCPAGYHSVVFDRQNGSLNETIVYSDDAIRPVFLLVFT